MSEKTNDAAWSRLFAEYHIAERVAQDGCFAITAEQIKKVREPRLMAKFDHASALPQPFAERGLSMLPTRRGSYLIAPMLTFHELESLDTQEPVPFISRRQFDSLSLANITSEAMALHGAYSWGILQDFTGDAALWPTISGRMGTPAFGFDIAMRDGKAMHVEVEGAQVEIDAGYEGRDAIYLLEAKMGEQSDFIVRQLYYPFRLWSTRVGKPVRTIFLCYSNGLYGLWEYGFEELENYSSIQLLTQRQYQVLGPMDESFSAKHLQTLLEQSCVAEPNDVPFPQADSLNRIISLCELLYSRGAPIEKKQLGLEISFKGQQSFALRQVDYYVNAARYLGLVDEFGPSVDLSPLGERFCTQGSLGLRIRFIAAVVLRHAPFQAAMRLYLRCGMCPSDEQVVSILLASPVASRLAASTCRRRAATVKNWISWIYSRLQ